MKRSACSLAVVTLVFFTCFASVTASLANDIDELYKSTNDILGAKEKTILASGHLRLVVWKSQIPQELMLLPITDLRANPENRFSSFLAYTMSDKGIFSTRVYQCSWREEGGKVVYECGESMRFPPGLRESVNDQVISEFKTVIRAAAQPARKTSPAGATN